MEIIEKSGIETCYSYSLSFERISCPGSGYGFDCDKDGVLLDPKKSMRVEELKRDPEFRFTGIERYIHKWKRPALGLCECGRKLHLPGFTNNCYCGRSYNWAGQKLSNPRHWGEETGEHPADISRI